MTGEESLIQLDGSFTRIGTRVLEALPLVKLNRTQQNICIFLWRRTYGWNRTRDSISLADFTTACGCCKEYISRQLKILMKKHIIRRIFVPGRPAIYSFVADVTEWEEGCIDLEALERNRESGIYHCAPEEMTDLAPYPEALWSDQAGDESGDLNDGSTAVGEEAGECPFMEGNWLTDCEAEEREEKFRQAVQQLISRLSPASPANTGQGLTDSSSQELTDRSSQELTNRSTPAHGSAPAGPDLAAPLKTVIKTDIKTDIKKLRKKKEFTPDMPSYQLSSLLLEKIKDNIPHFREPNLQDWSHAMDLLLRIDKKDEELVREVILFSQEDDFWLTNIHSPQKLRKHFYQLDMQRRRKRAGPRAPNTRSGTDDWRNESEEYEQFFK